MTEESARETATPDDAVTGLREVFPPPVTVELRSGPVQLRELGIDHFDVVVSAVGVLFAGAAGGDGATEYIARNKAALVTFTAAASGLDAATIRTMPGSESMALLWAAVEANEAFLSRSAGLVWGEMRERVLRMMRSPGQASSAA